MVKQQLKLLRIGKKKSIFQYVSLYVDFSVNSFANSSNQWVCYPVVRPDWSEDSLKEIASLFKG